MRGDPQKVRVQRAHLVMRGVVGRELRAAAAADVARPGAHLCQRDGCQFPLEFGTAGVPLLPSDRADFAEPMVNGRLKAGLRRVCH